MQKRFCAVPLLFIVVCSLASCNTAPRRAAVPTPESEQRIGETLKDLYMSVSAAVPQSAEQQKIVLRMAEKASNGKELFLVMRAAVGVFTDETQLLSKVESKMMDVATLDQLIDYATQYSVTPATARAFVQRMFELGDKDPDSRVWYRIKASAQRLKVADLGQQAQAKAESLANQ